MENYKKLDKIGEGSSIQLDNEQAGQYVLPNTSYLADLLRAKEHTVWCTKPSISYITAGL
jgi:hypothetical protein